MALTSIEWTGTFFNDIMYPGYTFNPWWGCMKKSRACKHCYAETLDKRWGGDHWGPGSDRRKFPDKHWDEPLKCNKYAESIGTRLKVFCASMADVFEDHPQVIDERKRLWKLIEATPWLNWLLLTKDPHNIHKMIPEPWRQQWPDNVWQGVTYEPGEDWRITELLKTKAIVKFLSVEPLYAPIPDLFEMTLSWLHVYSPAKRFMPLEVPVTGSGINWVIVGGESGNEASPMHPDWVKSIRDNVVAAKVPFFFKQWGEFGLGEGLGGKEYVMINKGGYTLKSKVEKINAITFERFFGFNPTIISKCGKGKAGRLLDGRTWDEMPVGILKKVHNFSPLSTQNV